MGTIVSIAVKPAGGESRPAERFARVGVESAELVAGKGIAGDRKAGARDRHLNVMSRATLDQLAAAGCRTGPGEMGEQVVLSGVDVGTLPAGTRLRLGPEAIIEVVQLRTPCARFEQVQKMSIKAAWGRIGVMCRVERGGPIRVGDMVEVLGIE